jgi:hypothetical protein
LMSLIQAGRIGITLTEGNLMIPRKSVSFAKPFGGEDMEREGSDPCPDCGLGDCMHRRGGESP